MGREVRRVPMDWQHPMEWTRRYDRGEGRTVMKLVPRPLFDADWYEDAVRDWEAMTEEEKHEEPRPERDRYMPEFDQPAEELGWAMYETTSEGTPISPTFADPDELAHWLADNGASSFGSATASYEDWKAMIAAGDAPSAVFSESTGLISGVEAVAHLNPRTTTHEEN